MERTVEWTKVEEMENNGDLDTINHNKLKLPDSSYYLEGNFNLTRDVLYKIGEVEGVDTIVSVSRYRVIVVFGKLFNHNEIIEKINKAILNKKSSIQKLLQKVAKKHKMWIIYVFPNSNIEILNYDTVEQYKKGLTFIKQVQSKSKGKIYTHESKNK
jgi:hypothetical protein